MLFFISLVYILMSGASGCLPEGKSKKVTIGKETYLCLYVASINFTAAGEYLLIPTKADADTMTKIKVPESWTSTAYRNDTLMRRINFDQQFAAGVGLGVTVSSMGVLSYQRIYRGSIAYVVSTVRPTQDPTAAPSVTSTSTDSPSFAPTFNPTFVPSISLSPSMMPSAVPSVLSSIEPSFIPTCEPSSSQPTTTAIPTTDPTIIPSAHPTIALSSARRRRLQGNPDPTSQPSGMPSSQPSTLPSSIPSTTPSTQPSTIPSAKPLSRPSTQPTMHPSAQPSSQPISPTTAPSMMPSNQPIAVPSSQPSCQPSTRPSIPTSKPSMTPSTQPSAMPVTNITSGGNGESSILYESVTFPLLLAIIIVDHGNVKNIVWDNTCSWCSSSQCLVNTVGYNENVVNGNGRNCYVEDTSCPKITTNGTKTSNALCELNVYIVWSGTDSSGTNFQSAAARFSRWSSYQLDDFTSVLQHEIAST